MNNMNVIIADDHPIVLFGIRKSLEQIEWVNVVGEFEDSTALINNLPKLDAHVLITDLSMPGDKYGDGITLIKYIKRHFPSLSIIVLTMNNNPAILSAVLDLDIEGIVLKQGAPTDLPKALAALQKGKKFTPESVSRLLEKISAGGYGDKRLSPKESEVLRLFAEGFLVTEIAKKLNRSIKTISSQKKSAMMKLGVENDIALLNYLSSVTLSPADKDYSPVGQIRRVSVLSGICTDCRMRRKRLIRPTIPIISTNYIKVGQIRRVSVASGICTECRMRRKRLIRPTNPAIS